MRDAGLSDDVTAETDTLRVSLLGAVRAARSGRPCRITSRRQRALLAALALGADGYVPVGDLIDAVWGEDPPEGAHTTLQTYVSRLRRELGAGAVEHGPAGYRLAPGTGVDVVDVRHLAAAARDHDDAAAVIEACTRALGAWEGQALAELDDNIWFRPAIAGLAELRSTLVELLAEAHLRAGTPYHVVALLEEEVERNPFRESTVLALVRALHAAGRGTEALRVADSHRRRLREETGLDPGAGLAEIESRILAGEAPTPPAPVATREARGSDTPTRRGALGRAGRFVGRDRERAELSRLVGVESLVTVHGPGGVGKTRLVAEVVDADAIVVELAPVHGGDVCAAVAAEIGYVAEQADPSAVADVLRSESALLVLDNCEHVLDEVADLCRVLTARCPAVRILATSRVPIGVAGERLLRLGPLDTTGDRSEASELFVERAVRAHGREELREDDPSVRRICERVDGLPLAVELAASRAAVLGVDALASRLAEDPGVLGGGDLERVVEWSYRLLGESEQRLLLALSVFAGDFDVAAAEAVGQAVIESSVALSLSRLVDAALVTVPGVDRYRLLEVIRHFARGWAADRGDAILGLSREAHARWVAGEVCAVDRGSVGPSEEQTTASLGRLRGDVVAALGWADASGEAGVLADLAVPLGGILLYRPDADLAAAARAAAGAVVAATPLDGETPVAVAALAATCARLDALAGNRSTVDELCRLARSGDEATRSRASHAAGVARLYEGRFDAAADGFAAAVAAGDVRGRLDALGGLGLALCYAGDVERAADVVAEHRGLSETVDSACYRAFAGFVAAEIEIARGHDDRAAELLERSGEQAWTVGATFVWGLASTVLAAVVVRRDDVEAARTRLPVLLRRWRLTATWPQLWTTLRLVAELLARHGRPETAALVLAAAERDAAAPALTDVDRARVDELTRRLERSLGDRTYAGVVGAAELVERSDVLERAVSAVQTL